MGVEVIMFKLVEISARLILTVELVVVIVVLGFVDGLRGICVGQLLGLLALFRTLLWLA